MRRVALYGGSFDPPHIGHEAIVLGLRELKRFDTIVVMPTYRNPFKSAFYAPAQLRITWLKKIFAPYDDVVISTFEADQKRAVATIESVKYLLKQFDALTLVIGADNLQSFGMWHNYDELIKLVEIIVVSRDAIEVPTKFDTLTVEKNISSSALRAEMSEHYLPRACVEEIIKFYKE